MSSFLIAVNLLLVTLQVMWFAAGETAVGQGMPCVCSGKSVTTIVFCMCRKDRQASHKNVVYLAK